MSGWKGKNLASSIFLFSFSHAAHLPVSIYFVSLSSVPVLDEQRGTTQGDIHGHWRGLHGTLLCIINAWYIVTACHAFLLTHHLDRHLDRSLSDLQNQKRQCAVAMGLPSLTLFNEDKAWSAAPRCVDSVCVVLTVMNCPRKLKMLKAVPYVQNSTVMVSGDREVLLSFVSYCLYRNKGISWPVQ